MVSVSAATITGAIPSALNFGPAETSFATVADVVEALVETYLRERRSGERFIDTSRRIGVAPYRAAADAVRRATAGVTA